jgi:DNA-binding protein HU-beta
MNKTQLIQAMSKKTGLTQKDSEKALNAMLATIEESLKDGEKVLLVGFGTFNVIVRAPRKGRNAQTGKEETIPGSVVPTFTFAKNMLDSINS